MHQQRYGIVIAQGITADGTQSIADSLYLHPSITELILAHNVLADQGTPILDV